MQHMIFDAEEKICRLMAEHLAVFAVSRADQPSHGLYVVSNEMAAVHLWNWAEVAARLADDALYANLRTQMANIDHATEFDTLEVHYCDTRAALCDTYGVAEMDTLQNSPKLSK